MLNRSRASNSPAIRFEQPSSSSMIREGSKVRLEVSQTSLQDLSNRMPQSDYYPESRREDGGRVMMQKIEELWLRVNKNTEEIGKMKNSTKNE